MTTALTTAQPPANAVDTWPNRLPRQSHLQEVLHESHWDLRHKFILALSHGVHRSLERRAARLAQCGSAVHFYIDPDADSVRPYLHRCGDRLCPFCARQRTAHVADQMSALVATFRDPRIIILTVKSQTDPLAVQLRSLRRNFAKLRRSKLWRDNVSAGVYTLECTANPQTGLWHPHLHIIYDGTYLPQKALRTQWHRATGDSEIVWIQRLKDVPGAVKELCKYIGKPAKAGGWTERQICEYAHATHGTRMVQSFGTAGSIKLRNEMPHDEPGPDTWLVSISRLVFLAHQGDATSQRLLDLIAARWPYLSSFIYHELPSLQPPELAASKTARMLALLDGRPPPAATTPRAPPDPDALDNQLTAHFRRFRLEQEDLAPQ